MNSKPRCEQTIAVQPVVGPVRYGKRVSELGRSPGCRRLVTANSTKSSVNRSRAHCTSVPKQRGKATPSERSQTAMWHRKNASNEQRIERWRREDAAPRLLEHCPTLQSLQLSL